MGGLGVGWGVLGANMGVYAGSVLGVLCGGVQPRVPQVADSYQAAAIHLQDPVPQ